MQDVCCLPSLKLQNYKILRDLLTEQAPLKKSPLLVPQASSKQVAMKKSCV